MNTRFVAAGIIGVMVIAGGAFWGGLTYAKGNAQRGPGSGQFTGAARGGIGGNAQRSGGFTAGEIISNDGTSITIKMQDGSTKIVLVSDSTEVMKSASGALSDLAVGTSVTVSGTSNSDGSVTAQTVQIRPAGAPPFGGSRAGQN